MNMAISKALNQQNNSIEISITNFIPIDIPDITVHCFIMAMDIQGYGCI
jgi:hypothetical protein